MIMNTEIKIIHISFLNGSGLSQIPSWHLLDVEKTTKFLNKFRKGPVRRLSQYKLDAP
jgi:hypothetical protein